MCLFLSTAKAMYEGFSFFGISKLKLLKRDRSRKYPVKSRAMKISEIGGIVCRG